ncbi:hypothetical protein N7466_005339 [Penicillium verhagenii]|uniref:uncharacterized protein n=1 Tax=Penicillium verhagenii TaxID=1562060 RepID=UPI002545200A|nr:uncharacterized protein N7466_005339 [Penicillium verhagenii]KAJ5935792.1 hypothetical protein N7466_005339 [Penicillium verhagenii]
MSFNRLAVYAHRGWASSVIFDSIAHSGAPVRVLYRPGSDISTLPSGVQAIEVDTEDQDALRSSLKDIDILISLVGQAGIEIQYAFIKALPHTDVKLFVPSDLAFRSNEQGLRVRVNKVKDEVENAAKAAGIPMTIVLPGLFAESALSSGLLGIDLAKNRIIFSGDGENQRLNICTREYIAAGYASLFPKTPIADLQGRVIGLAELRPTGGEIAKALEKKHGSPPQIFRQSLEEIDRKFEERMAGDGVLTLPYACRRLWGTGDALKAVGSDVWEVEGYQKSTLDELFNGGISSYRDFPTDLIDAVDATFY